MCSNIIKKLDKKGFISQITNKEDLFSIVNKKNITLYCGFDATSDSLHLGHLIPILCLKKFQESGHHPIILIGGATSLIGDPSFKKKERNYISYNLICRWKKKIKKQLSNFLDFENCKNKAIILDNYDWFKNINILKFLRKIGKYYSVNKMINKDFVKKRINNIDKGISFTEFSYTLLQGYDFSWLYKKYDAILQIGGSDQWGNIISGIDLSYKLHRAKLFGLTTPLFLKNNGEKFGKTNKENIWLNEKKTSPYEFYQFWLNLPDNNILNSLKLFTSFNIKEINSFKDINSININTKKYLKSFIADEITSLIHGSNILLSLKNVTKKLFNKTSNNLTYKDFCILYKYGIPSINLTNNKIFLRNFLVDSLIAKSLTQARNMILSNSIYINNKLINNTYYIFNDLDKLFNKFTLLCKGKKNFFLIKWI
ncbi:tyrosine--tRNA ligase [Buchnera aphidicola (Taiwanaphis decaspermi)]|uniref:tyrosine--tRNA ligase n=1 Tax=Buchnera aphidicola TaxID=9 RepID=UPI0031B85F20